MTLFEAIRELKEGQIIEGISPIQTRYASSDGESGSSSYNPCHVEWRHGKDKPTLIDSTMDLNTIVRIVDLPRPKMTLEEGLYEAAEAIPYELLENPSPRQFTKHFVNTLRYLPIDWQAEADRKDNLK